ncbi:LysR family transcriptional regulator [Thiomicrorhabdus sp. zzn3]|uniref:LysR family transcriptional regulator n=1 Tax=Thiomicrorhabdus sp. zzn3 TaxID=3039775 RepID=UPI0024368340|nr:LysR family transcriptional regulator [Thiomicrorhabdus sp. zzn3]MDG6778518.1 LysR family transcriptional regulator [Thiomicrorhabdus sp. zzn3]
MGRLEEIQIFIRIVEAGGIGRAAEQMSLAKSAVSRRLSDLEERLACKLIQRTTRSLSLTDAGRIYYEQALKLVEQYEAMNQAILQGEQALSGSLRIAVPLSFGLSHLTPVLDEFAKRHPQLKLNVDFSDRQVDLVEEGFDLAFRIGDLKESAIQARRIVPIRFVLCASPEYLAEYGEPHDHETLRSHKILRYTASNGVLPLVDPQGNAHQVHFDSQIQANNGDFLKRMAMAGHGIVFSPTFIAWEAIKNGELVPVLSDYTLPEMNAYAVYPQNRFLAPKARAFIDFLVERFGNRAYWDEPLD